MTLKLHDARCTCGRLLGKINGDFEIKCPRCKSIQLGKLPKPLNKMYDKQTGE